MNYSAARGHKGLALYFIPVQPQHEHFRHAPNAMRSCTKAMSSRNVDWPELISNSEWLGKKTEKEVDIARQDEWRQRQLRDRFPGSGVSFGVGF